METTATCIVALKQGDVIYIGGDSAGTESHSLKSTVRKDPKVFTKEDSDENKWLFGFTTSYRMGQLIQHVLILPSIDKKDEKNMFGYMVKKFIPALQKCLREGGFESKKEDRVSGGTFIVAVRNQIFKIQSDYQVSMAEDDFYAAGCGEDLALGALYATKEDPDPEKRVRTALEAAERFSAGVRGPFILVKS